MLQISNRRGPRCCWMQTTSRMMTGERSCKMVPMPALESWMVKKQVNWQQLTPARP